MPTSAFLVQKGVTWITPADVAAYTYQGHTARLKDSILAAQVSTDPTYLVLFNFPVPVRLGDIAVKITQLTIYYYTAAAGDYIDRIELRKGDLAGSYTSVLDYTTDLGNGSTGNANASLLAAALTLDDAPYQLVVKLAGINDYDDVRIYGFKVTWEAT